MADSNGSDGPGAPFWKRLGISAVCTVLLAPVSYSLQGAFRHWGILDPFAARLGDILAMNISPTLAAWSAAAIVSIGVYGFILWRVWVWGRTGYIDRSHYHPEWQAETKPTTLLQAEPTRGGTSPSDQRVTSHGQSGGITAHTVNMTAPDRHLNEDMKAGLLKMIPKDRLIHVICPMSDSEAYRLGSEIWQYMRANGYQMSSDGLSVGMLVPPAPRGVNIDLTKDASRALICVGPR